MKRVAKLLIQSGDEFLLLELNNHPIFGNDMDLPGGTIDDNESDIEALMREVKEETGLVIDPKALRLLYTGTDYSENGTYNALFLIILPEKPLIHLSWEHTN